MSMRMMNKAPKLMKKEGSLLDLPESILECILQCLSPQDLCSVSEVCSLLLRRCRCNGLWEKHIQRKWGRLLGDAVHREWERHITRIMNKETPSLRLNPNGFLGSFSGDWPLLCLASYLDNPRDLSNLLLSNYSNLALYISLQSGRFWFPAQVYRIAPRLKIYDALLSYDNTSNTFRARSPVGEWQVIEENIQWERVRLSQVDTLPHTLYVSHCLNDLEPGDHIEIQMKRIKDRPFDWNYGVVGHLESCDENENHCRCKYNDMLVVRFKYRPESPWRPIMLNKKVNGEQIIRYWIYGGIRKLNDQKDIQYWKSLYTIHSS